MLRRAIVAWCLLVGSVAAIAAAVTIVAAALRLTWTDNSEVETAYWVLRQRVPTQRDFTWVANLPPNTQEWVDRRTRGNQTYCYMVVAVAGNERSYSNVACGSEGKDFGAGVGVVRVGWASTGRVFNINVGE